MLRIHIGPALEATNSYTNTITWAVRPIHNFRIVHLNPGLISPTTGAATITQREIAYYARGAYIWAQVNQEEGGAFSIDTIGSPLLVAGLHIQISAGEDPIPPQKLHYPAGTLPEGGFCLRVDLTPFMQHLTHARQRAPALFDNIPRPINPGSSQQLPLPINQRAISGPTVRPHLARRIEHQRNQDRGHHLNNSRLF